MESPATLVELMVRSRSGGSHGCKWVRVSHSSGAVADHGFHPVRDHPVRGEARDAVVLRGRCSPPRHGRRTGRELAALGEAAGVVVPADRATTGMEPLMVSAMIRSLWT